MTAQTNKTYDIRSFRRGQHGVSFHDGVKTYADGSPFNDLVVFTNYKDAVKFVNVLKADGYRPQY